jgi:hypothetical protein
LIVMSSLSTQKIPPKQQKAWNYQGILAMCENTGLNDNIHHFVAYKS